MPVRRRLVLVSPDRPDAVTLARLEELLPGLALSVDLVILRWKSDSDAVLVRAARRLQSIAPRPPLLLSGRFDLARAAGLEGVQLGEEGLSADAVRAHWPEAILGVSRHGSEGLARRSAGADFALLSPVFASATKPGEAPLGLDQFGALCARAKVPVLALGGVTCDEVDPLVVAGAAGIAVRSAILDHADPLAAAHLLRHRLDSAGPPPPDHELVSGADG